MSSARLVYEREHGQVPDGAHIHHLCGRSYCTNVEHLVAVFPHDHAKFHRYLCDVHRTSKTALTSRGSDNADLFAEYGEYLNVIDPFEEST